MENLFIEGTDCFPNVAFNTDGKCLIEGKSIPEDAKTAYDPLFTWVKLFAGEKIELDVNLYYFNTASSKMIFDLFETIEANQKIKTITIRWHFEEGDEEMMEAGEMYEDMLDRSTFDYIEYAEMI